MNIKRDVPIVLGDIQYEDNYDGDFNVRRAVIYTMNLLQKLIFMHQQQMLMLLEKYKVI